jgi:histidine triad (HIT) family protein
VSFVDINAMYKMKSTENPTGADPCVFCSILEGELTPGVIAYQDSETAVFPSKGQRPQNRGHMLVVPVAHIPYIYNVDRDLGGSLMATVRLVAKAVKKLSSADGITIRQNNEQHGGQDVFHVHFHVIPRFANDGFDHGEDRFPFGGVEIPYEERIDQANLLRNELSVDPH